MIGKTVSHYRITEKLGEGGMGEVYRAEDTKLGRVVALKFLPPGLARDAEARSRFTHEARAASALDHPNICTVYDIDETDDGRIFIVMAYVGGASLKERLGRRPLELHDAIDKVIQIGEGLARAHESGIVHRDIKPANIMITERERVKIVDFGLSKLTGGTKLTREGTTLGTAEYMSPEQTSAGDADSRTDIWSLGVVLYEAITGLTPFRGDYDQATMYRILHEEPEPVTALRSGIPVELDRIISKALAKDPSERYQHVSDMLVDLRSVLKRLDRGAVRDREAAVGRKVARIAIPAAMLLIIAGLFIMRDVFFADEAAAIDSIAVLPLENLSKDPGEDYFADGMTEALIANLAQIGSLKVISRTSMMRYKGSDKPLPEIARELKVASILEGSVIRENDRVRITAQLIDARTDQHIWADTYDHQIEDVLGLQSEVARAIASQIRITLTESEQEKLNEVKAVVPEAHEAYLRGRYNWNKRTKEGMESSIALYREAISFDPGYALAYAGLAEAFIVFGQWGFMMPADAYTKGKEAAMNALELDPDLAQAHTAYAGLLYMESEWEEADREFRLAIELNPNYETARQWYAEYLFSANRYAEAFMEIDVAVELDPLSLIINSVKGSMLYHSRRFDESIVQMNKVLELEPRFTLPRHIIEYCYVMNGMYDEAMKEFKITMDLVGVPAEVIETLDGIYRESGYKGIFRWSIEYGMDYIDQTYNKPFYIAELYGLLHDSEKVYEYIEKALEYRTMYIFWLKDDPVFDFLHDDPRFRELVERMGVHFIKRSDRQM